MGKGPTNRENRELAKLIIFKLLSCNSQDSMYGPRIFATYINNINEGTEKGQICH